MGSAWNFGARLFWKKYQNQEKWNFQYFQDISKMEKTKFQYFQGSHRVRDSGIIRDFHKCSSRPGILLIFAQFLLKSGKGPYLPLKSAKYFWSKHGICLRSSQHRKYVRGYTFRDIIDQNRFFSCQSCHCSPYLSTGPRVFIRFDSFHTGPQVPVITR